MIETNHKAKTGRYLSIVLFLTLSIVGVSSLCRLKTKTTYAETIQPRGVSKDKTSNVAEDNQQKPPVPTTLPARPINTTTTSVTQTAVQIGVLSSIKKIDQVISYLTLGTQYGACLFYLPQQPDNSIFSTSLEIIPEGAASVYASASFAPLPGGRPSEAVYDIVQYIPKTPAELRKTLYKDVQNESILKENIIMLDAGNVKIFLMPAGKDGCVVIKKEVVR